MRIVGIHFVIFVTYIRLLPSKMNSCSTFALMPFSSCVHYAFYQFMIITSTQEIWILWFKN